MAFSIWIFVTCQIQTGNQYLSIFVCLTTESSVSFDMKNLKGTRSGYRDSLWNILRHYSIPSQLVHLINCKSFYNNFRCSVGHNNFNVKTGVRQGCVTVCITVKLGHRLGHAEDNRKLPKRVPLGPFLNFRGSELCG